MFFIINQIQRSMMVNFRTYIDMFNCIYNCLFDIHKLYDIVHYTIDLGLPFITLISSNLYIIY